MLRLRGSSVSGLSIYLLLVIQCVYVWYVIVRCIKSRIRESSGPYRVRFRKERKRGTKEGNIHEKLVKVKGIEKGSKREILIIETRMKGNASGK